MKGKLIILILIYSLKNNAVGLMPNSFFMGKKKNPLTAC